MRCLKTLSQANQAPSKDADYALRTCIRW